MATLTAQQISKAGVIPTYATAAAGGDQVIINPKTVLHIKNAAAGGTVVVTFNSQTACDQGFDHDETVSIADGAEKFIGPFDPKRYADANGFMLITYDEVTGLTIAAFEN